MESKRMRSISRRKAQRRAKKPLITQTRGDVGGRSPSTFLVRMRSAVRIRPAAPKASTLSRSFFFFITKA